MIKIAIDAMGGDYAPKEQVEGAVMAIKNIEDIELTLYGDEVEIRKYLTDETRITIVQSDGVISMGEKDPIAQIRGNRKSSMALALSSVRSGDNSAIVSSGATQALIAGAHILVGRLKQMKRTAIAPLIPRTDGGTTILLDAGGNLEIKPEFMVQQAYFAQVYSKEVLNVENPKLGLLNIGTEPGKGRQLDKEVFKLFTDNEKINFIGNIESKEILSPPCDILISDGFTANMVMKTIVGTAKGMGQMLKQELKQGFFGKLGMLLSARNLKRFKYRLNPEEIGGAMIYGLKGVVVKAQGSSTNVGFYNAIKVAAIIVRKDVLNKVKTILESDVL
ncbi:MAG: Phosphate acyltransferase [Candidatus Izimaplasma bacterium HR2]|nr:MAG: Phosphate acyltransferase [Candidatus Izimaplasma bacterium HR2]